MNHSTRRLCLPVVAFISWTWMVRAWMPAVTSNGPRRIALDSTPFEFTYYEGDENDGPTSPLACPPETKLCVGLNKYSHDTSLCAADAETGQVLFAISKERLSRKKHDSGNIVSLVESCLQALDLDLDAIEKVVMNNHHHRILPLEDNLAHMEWESGLGINGGVEEGYEEEENLLSDAERLELSHHLAHAYSTASQAPFDSGMVVVMDGMGETYRTMLRAKRTDDKTYISDLSFGEDSFQCIPSDLEEQSKLSYFDWREAESVYVFTKSETSLDVRPVFKRFTPERSAPTLYNHGFENMDSAGALYSRASSHIFGDWNACGKVMGLAPWMGSSWTDGNKSMGPERESRRIMWGSLYSEEKGKTFEQDKDVLAGMPLATRLDSDMFDEEGNLVREGRYDFDDDEGSGQGKSDEKRLPTQVALDAISIAHRIQVDLEEIVMDFVKHFKESTGEENLCIAGGVGLNSVLNGRLSRELGFKQTFNCPYPGDDGIAIGCCAYALFGNAHLDEDEKKSPDDSTPLVWKEPLSPYMGPMPTEDNIKEAIEKAAPWLEVEAIRDEDTLLDLVAQEISTGGVVAWYQGRSEMGPRALGHRSILADPRKKGLVRFINEKVKKRESFRPFAPSVLAEHATDWFDLGILEESVGAASVSPYMSITAMVHEDKRALIPAVTHVDGSSRLQSVGADAEPLYHKLIQRFYDLTGVPMVLNTSFNTLPGEPIVETPENAIRSFLCSMGAIEFLVMGDYVIRRKAPNLKKLLGELDGSGEYMLTEPVCPKRAGATTFQTSFDTPEGKLTASDEPISTVTKVRMPARPMHHAKNEWFEVMDELEGELLSICDGTVSLNDILAQYTSVNVDEGEDVTSKEQLEKTELILQNVVHRLVRLYEHTLISW